MLLNAKKNFPVLRDLKIPTYSIMIGKILFAEVHWNKFTKLILNCRDCNIMSAKWRAILWVLQTMVLLF